MSEATVWEMPSTPADVAKINAAVDEIVASMVRKSAESDFIKEVKKRLKDEFGMPPKIVQRFAKTAFDRNLEQQRVENETFYETYLAMRGRKEGLLDDGDEDE